MRADCTKTRQDQISKSLEAVWRKRRNVETASYRLEEIRTPASRTPTLGMTPDARKKADAVTAKTCVSFYRHLRKAFKRKLAGRTSAYRTGARWRADKRWFSEAGLLEQPLAKQQPKKGLEAFGSDGEADAKMITFLEIERRGGGGTESCDWANICAECTSVGRRKKGYKVELQSERRGEEPGFKSATTRSAV